MVFINWHEAQRFCDRINARERAAGRLPEGYEYRLPTEAQWEYAARAGSTTAAYRILGERNAPVLDAIAWYGGNSSVGYEGTGSDSANWKEKQYPGGTAGYRRVGIREPNAWGFYDMLGNVWEWCDDWYVEFGTAAVTDPTGPATGTNRVNHGGGWNGAAAFCRSADRGWSTPGFRNSSVGFRLALAPSR